MATLFLDEARNNYEVVREVNISGAVPLVEQESMHWVKVQISI